MFLFPLAAELDKLMKHWGKIEAKLLENQWVTVVFMPGLWAHKHRQDNNVCFCMICFSGGCTWRYITYSSVTDQHHSCRTIQWMIKYQRNWTGQHQHMYGQSSYHEWMAFWFHYSGQKGDFRMWVYTLCHSKRNLKMCKKCHLNLTVFCRMWIKLSSVLKNMLSTYICLDSSWADSSRT